MPNGEFKTPDRASIGECKLTYAHPKVPSPILSVLGKIRDQKNQDFIPRWMEQKGVYSQGPRVAWPIFNPNLGLTIFLIYLYFIFTLFSNTKAMQESRLI